MTRLISSVARRSSAALRTVSGTATGFFSFDDVGCSGVSMWRRER
jgi:hypothetical protein